MWHGGRTDFISSGFLPEVTERNIAPDIAVQVEKNRIDTDMGIEQLCHGVMRFDLGGIWIETQAELLDERSRKRFPVEIRKSNHVRIVVTHCSIDFSGNDHGCKPLARPA